MRPTSEENGLVERARDGDPAAFAALCERHRDQLWRVAASVVGGAEAEDLAQEALIRAFAGLRSFRADAPFGAWLCRIALNLAHDTLRAHHRRLRQLPPGEAVDERAASPETEVLLRDVKRRVRQAVARLPAAQRVPIWLHYFEGYALADVARLEDVSESTVRSRVQAGLRRLELALDDLLPETECAPFQLEPGRTGCGA